MGMLGLESSLGLALGVTYSSLHSFSLLSPRELATYDAAKRAVLSSGLAGDDLWGHLLSSVASGLVASLVSTPADVVKTRLMNQDPARPMYR